MCGQEISKQSVQIQGLFTGFNCLSTQMRGLGVFRRSARKCADRQACNNLRWCAEAFTNIFSMQMRVFTAKHFYIIEKPLNPCICTDKQQKPATKLRICVEVPD